MVLEKIGNFQEAYDLLMSEKGKQIFSSSTNEFEIRRLDLLSLLGNYDELLDSVIKMLSEAKSDEE